jgi:hypothetical protein
MWDGRLRWIAAESASPKEVRRQMIDEIMVQLARLLLLKIADSTPTRPLTQISVERRLSSQTI